MTSLQMKFIEVLASQSPYFRIVEEDLMSAAGMRWDDHDTMTNAYDALEGVISHLREAGYKIERRVYDGSMWYRYRGTTNKTYEG